MVESTGVAVTEKAPWRISLHGGHSGQFCEHAKGTLRELLEEAVEQEFAVYGISEHAPRYDERHLFDTERELGWDTAKLKADFDAYAVESAALVNEFADRLTVLRGFEIESVPEDRYIELMKDIDKRENFDYMVGSVHFIEDIPVDGPKELFDEAVRRCGGLEKLGLKYYAKVREMVNGLKPEIVAHLDLIRKNAPSNGSVDTPKLRNAARETLETVKASGAILEVNTAGYRKGIVFPYPAPWLVQEAHSMDIPFCFGDDSHSPAEVGQDLELAREYLLELGVNHVVTLDRIEGEITRRSVDLT